MSVMPALANIFGYYDPAPENQRQVHELMRGSGEFERVVTLDGGWVVGWKCLPDSCDVGREFNEHHLIFAEGRDRLDAVERPGTTWRRLTHVLTPNPEELGRFPGDFGFVQFRPHGHASIVRSCGGLVPFYYWQHGDRKAVTTFYTWFVRFTRHQFELDPLPNALWAMAHAMFPDNRTFLRDVSIVPRGHCVTLGDRDAFSTQYWDPRPHRLPRMTRGTQREHADRLRAILFNKLAAELHPAGGNLLTLSGGVDSSALGWLATRHLDRRIGTFSVVPAREDLLAVEMRFIAPVIAHPNVERSWFLPVDGKAQLDLIDAAPDVAFHIPHPALWKLRDIHREWPVRVLFGGEWADEICGSHFTMQDWKEHMPLGRLIFDWLGGRMPVGPLDPLRVIKHRLRAAVGRNPSPFAEMPDLFSDRVRAEYRHWTDRRLKAMHDDGRPWAFLSEHLRQTDGYIAMNWEATSALGIRRSLPFVNREMLELTYACRPEELVGPQTKKILRRALRNDVPYENLHRSDKGGWGRHIQRSTVIWNRRLSPMVASIVRDDLTSQGEHRIDVAHAVSLCLLERLLSQLMASRLVETVG